MRLLLTRPQAEAARTAAALRARGHEPILAPLLDIELLSDADLGAGPWTAILLTSANAVRAIAVHPRHDELRSLVVFTVGARTAQAMREAGFSAVVSADGNVRNLADLVAARVEPGARLLYLAGEEHSGDLGGVLSARGFTVDTVLVYRAVLARCLPRQAVAALAAGIDGVLHFSRRSVEAYIGATSAPELVEPAVKKPVHFCLSDRVAEPLKAAGATAIRIAARPDEAALLALCD